MIRRVGRCVAVYPPSSGSSDDDEFGGAAAFGYRRHRPSNRMSYRRYGQFDDDIDNSSSFPNKSATANHNQTASSNNNQKATPNSSPQHNAATETNSTPTTSRIWSKLVCKLCPDKTFIAETDVEKHLKSKRHLRREREWEQSIQTSENQTPENEGSENHTSEKQSFEMHKFEREVSNDSAVKTNGNYNNSSWRSGKASLRKEKIKAARKRKVLRLTPEQIERRKHAFQEKKQRRLARKCWGATTDTDQSSSANSQVA